MRDDDPPEWSLREDEGLHHRDCEKREPCLLAEPFDQVHPRVLRLWGGCKQLEKPPQPQRPSLTERDFPANRLRSMRSASGAIVCDLYLGRT